MRSVLVLTALICGAGSALAQECAYSSGVGPRLEVSDQVDAITVDMGDWVEVCPLVDDERGNTHIPGLSGWSIPRMAQCKAFAGQFAFVDVGGAEAVVFNGLTFVRDCAPEAKIKLREGFQPGIVTVN